MSQSELLTVLETRREYCRAMLELSREQQALIESNRHSELLQVVAKKQRVLEGLQQLGTSFGGLSRCWRGIRDHLPPDLKAACEAALAESEQLLAAVVAEENRGLEQLASHRDMMQRKLQEVGEQLSLQGGPKDAEPRFLDVAR